MSSLVLIEAGIKEAGIAFLPSNNINDTLVEGISRTIQYYLENQTMKQIRTGICLTRLTMVKNYNVNKFFFAFQFKLKNKMSHRLQLL